VFVAQPPRCPHHKCTPDIHPDLCPNDSCCDMWHLVRLRFCSCFPSPTVLAFCFTLHNIVLETRMAWFLRLFGCNLLRMRAVLMSAAEVLYGHGPQLRAHSCCYGHTRSRVVLHWHISTGTLQQAHSVLIQLMVALWGRLVNLVWDPYISPWVPRSA
jgi:hypothetical protein